MVSDDNVIILSEHHQVGDEELKVRLESLFKVSYTFIGTPDPEAKKSNYFAIMKYLMNEELHMRWRIEYHCGRFLDGTRMADLLKLANMWKYIAEQTNNNRTLPQNVKGGSETMQDIAKIVEKLKFHKYQS